MPERDPKRFPHEVDGIWYSDKKVLQSGAGYYIGTTCWDPDMGGFEDMGSRESGYFATREEAERALKSLYFEVRDCAENESAYERGLPKPEEKPAPKKTRRAKKPRFRIGDFVSVTAVTTSSHRRRGEGDSPSDPGSYKVLRREELEKPVRGWVVGAVRRYEGRIHGSYSDDGDRPYLRCHGSRLLWKVAQSMTNAPLEVADEDVTLIAKPNNWTHMYLDNHEWVEIPVAPMRLGTPWAENYRELAATLRAEQREIMSMVERDKKGRWRSAKDTLQSDREP